MEAALQIDNLSKSYSDFRLDGISLSVPKGRIVGLIGENGAGKTTTINLILYAIEKDNGNISIFGKDHVSCEKEVKQSKALQDNAKLFAFLQSNGINSMQELYEKVSAMNKIFMKCSTQKPARV